MALNFDKDLDKEGFLRDLENWNEAVALELATIDEVTLTDAHWELIHFIRGYYDAYNVAPANRALVNVVKKNLGADKGNSIYLMKLFTGKPAKVLSRIAGLPKPNNCD